MGLNRAHWALLLVVFVDMLGLGILAPMIPFYVVRLGVGPEIVTLVLAAYSLSQCIGMPIWGRVSDRIGRRPVLLISMAGHALAFLLLAIADQLWLLVASRILGGFASANLATAYAYIADTTTEEDRAASLGRISAAFGLGFIFGPLLGGFLAAVGVGEAGGANFLLPALAAMSLSCISFLGVLLLIPESLPAHRAEATQAMRAPPARLLHICRQPMVCKAIALCFLTVIFIAGREAIFPLWANAQHDLSIQQIGLVIALGALAITLFQIVCIGPATRAWGEVNLVRTAVALYGISWLGLALASGLGQIMAAFMIGSVAMAMLQTPLQTLLSKQAGAEERGSVLGLFQATSSLGRFSGQAASGSVYGQAGPDALFLIGAVAMLPALAVAFSLGVGAAGRAAARPASPAAPGRIS